MTQYTRPDAAVPVWAETGSVTQPTNPEIQAGWPSSPTPPSRQRFNWILYWCSRAVRYLLQRGLPEWASGEDYPLHARVQYGGETYRCLLSGTTATPGTDATKWERWGHGDTQLQPRVDSLLTKSVAGGSDVTLTAAEADNGILIFTGLLTANINVVLPNTARRWVIYNATTGSYTLSLKTSTGAPVLVTQANSVVAYCDAANTIALAGSAATAAISRATYTASASQASFALTYTPGAVFMVTRNGVSIGFTATSGTAVVIDVAASSGDAVVIFVASSFSVANAVQKSGDTMTGPFTLAGDATSPLHAVTKQQLDASVPDASATVKGKIEIADASEAAAGTDNTRALTPAGLRSGLGATGSAPVYGVRAWVKFNGTGTPAVIAGGNVSGITDNGTGDYTINFTTPMPTANYTPSYMLDDGATNNGPVVTIDSANPPTTSELRINTWTGNGTAFDPAIICVQIVC